MLTLFYCELNKLLQINKHSSKRLFQTLHRWIVRCHPDYVFNLQFTHFKVEAEFDDVTLFDVTEGSRRLISEVSGLGTTETNTNNLMINFQSDCDVTMSGFRAVVSTFKRNDVQETTLPVATTDIPETTQTTMGWYTIIIQKIF